MFAAVLGLTAPTLLLAAEQPPPRAGLWVMQRAPQTADEKAQFETMVRSNPHLAGVCLHLGWKHLENKPDQFDFSPIDQAVTVLRELRKPYELGVDPGADTPSFVYEQGAQQFVTRGQNPHRSNFGQPIVIPIPWDPIYQARFSRIIERLGQRYAADPLCVSVVLTCANFMGAEMHLPNSPEDRAKWTAIGESQTKLLQVYKKYTDVWAAAFPHQAISLHLSQVWDLPQGFFDEIIEYGLERYPQRYTIQNCQLNGRQENTGLLSYQLVLKYAGRAHHGFQSVAGFSHTAERMGSIEMAVLNVLHAKGEYWELWQGDGRSVEISGAIEQAWQEGRQLGYDRYKQKLIEKGLYNEKPYGRERRRR